MRRWLGVALGAALMLAASTADAACTYFAALDQDVHQPGQRAFITWDPVEKIESFTVQPQFEGNARDFGMVIPTPSRPKLKEAPREIFKDLALFTVLEPRPCTMKYKRSMAPTMAGKGGGGPPPKPKVTVLEAGVVGTLDYKIIRAEDAADLYTWLRDNGYSYAGDESTLDFYVSKKWLFTVMKIDPSAMTKRPDGTYEGNVSPTRFQFTSTELVYPLRITQTSVKDTTNALLYVMTKDKIDLPGSKLEYAKRLKAADIKKLHSGKVSIPQPSMNPDPPQQHDFKDLRGWLVEGFYLTKVRRIFRKEEMTDDLRLQKASDNTEYTSYEDCGGVPP